METFDNDFYLVSAKGIKSYINGRDSAYSVALDIATKCSSPCSVYKWNPVTGAFELDGEYYTGGGRA